MCLGEQEDKAMLGPFAFLGTVFFCFFNFFGRGRGGRRRRRFLGEGGEEKQVGMRKILRCGGWRLTAEGLEIGSLRGEIN